VYIIGGLQKRRRTEERDKKDAKRELDLSRER